MTVERISSGAARLGVIALGGDHDLFEHIRKIPGCDYFRVFVEGYPSADTREGT